MMNLVRFAAPALLASVAAAVATSCKGSYEITVTNLCYGQPLSPPLIVAHDDTVMLYEPLSAPTAELIAIAETGNSGPFQTLLKSATMAPHVYGLVASTTGPVLAGNSWTGTLTIGDDVWCRKVTLSAIGMLGSTNDGFFGLSIPFPVKGGYFFAPGWDAGSEKNNQDCTYVPGPACPGSPNMRMPTGAEGFTTIHRGYHEGIGDVDVATYDWRNPVAAVYIKKM